MTSPIDPPTLTLGVDDLVDWLELTAIFDDFGVARLDPLLASLLQLQEEAEDNIGERDREREQLVERLENEIELRSEAVGAAYPFALSDTGEELTLADNWRDPCFAYYLICLITSHVSGSAILRRPPTEGLLIRLRNRVFQIVATLGLAGLSSGPTLSIGWPRNTGETIIQLLERAVLQGAGFAVRKPPSPHVSPAEKDGGIDILSWMNSATAPPVALYFAQTASGKNWPGKPVSVHVNTFRNAYMLDIMTGNILYCTIIPYRVLNDDFWQSQHLQHSSILDRLRLPGHALQGSQVAESGVPVDDAENQHELGEWLEAFIDYAKAA